MSTCSFDTDTQVDESGHAYLPFHPRSFGFPFGFETSSSKTGEIAARQASDLLAGMLANPVDLAAGLGNEYGKAGESTTALGVTMGIDHDQSGQGMGVWKHVDPAELNIDRRSSGASVEEGMDSACSSRSVSPELVERVKEESETNRPSIRVDTDVPKRTGVESGPDEDTIVCVVPPKRGARRKSGAVPVEAEQEEDRSGRKSKKVKPTPKRNSTTTSASSTSNTTATSNNTNNSDRPVSAFHITDPPHPFSFKDLGLAPPPPFSRAGDGEHPWADEDGEEGEGKSGPDGTPFRGKRREMNRVAAKRHREKNKDRLKSLETRKAWLDHAVEEYEKSNKRLSETLDRLKRENVMLKTAEVVV